MVLSTSTVDFLCPYCSAPLSYRVEIGDGTKQSDLIDCEVCCKPIVLEAKLEQNGEFSVQAEKE